MHGRGCNAIIADAHPRARRQMPRSANAALTSEQPEASRSEKPPWSGARAKRPKRNRASSTLHDHQLFVVQAQRDCARENASSGSGGLSQVVVNYERAHRAGGGGGGFSAPKNSKPP